MFRNSVESSPGSMATTLTPGQLLGAVDPGLILLAVDHVELARLEREIATRIGGDVAIHDLVEFRRAAEILFVGDEAHVLLRLVFGEHERAGADRLLRKAVAHLLRGFLADHVAAVDVGDVAEEPRDRMLQRDLQRVFVDGVDVVDAGEVVRIGRRVLVRGALDRIGRVFRRELAVSPVALDALADVEGPFRAGRIGGPALGEVGFDCVSGLIWPGFRRTRPLKIYCSRPLSGVVEAMCGSSLPASAEPMPMTRVFFCAAASPAESMAAKASPATKIFRICPLPRRVLIMGATAARAQGSPVRDKAAAHIGR